MMMMIMTLEKNVNKNLKLKSIRMSLDVYKIKSKHGILYTIFVFLLLAVMRIKICKHNCRLVVYLYKFLF
jgi:hypothetical protein